MTSYACIDRFLKNITGPHNGKCRSTTHRHTPQNCVYSDMTVWGQRPLLFNASPCYGKESSLTGWHNSEAIYHQLAEVSRQAYFGGDILLEKLRKRA